MTLTNIDCHVDQDTEFKTWDGTRGHYPVVSVDIVHDGGSLDLFFSDVADLERLQEACHRAHDLFTAAAVHQGQEVLSL